MNHLNVSLENDSDSTNPNSPYYNKNRMIDMDDEQEEDNQVECPVCLGQGSYYDGGGTEDYIDCKTCNGTGVVDKDFEVTPDDLDELED